MDHISDNKKSTKKVQNVGRKTQENLLNRADRLNNIVGKTRVLASN